MSVPDPQLAQPLWGFWPALAVGPRADKRLLLQMFAALRNVELEPSHGMFEDLSACSCSQASPPASFTPQTSLRRSDNQNQHVFFSSPRTDDDSTTERKVASVLETVHKIKWKSAESVEGQEEKVCPGGDVCCHHDVLVRKKQRYCVAERLPPPPVLHLGLRS